MNFQSIITGLYFLLIYADGKVNDRELTSAKRMLRSEGMDESQFRRDLESYKTRDHDQLLEQCIEGLRRLEQAQQIRIVAWLCVLANADGFMDRSEWQLIYRIYHKELTLPLNEIFSVQKELNKIVWLTTPEELDQKAV